MTERITYKAAKERLPYLDAVLTESMRIRTIAGDNPLRVVPEGGRQIGGVFIPGGYQVGVAAHVIHNYSQYWDEPEKFMPERFLEGTPEEISARRQLVTPFGVGVRSCIGRQLAMVELVVDLATIIQQFEIKPIQNPYVPLKMQSGFVMSPVNKSLIVNIRPRN
ncbi:cytochrome P450 [Ramicandelaber brevisporus]|nr:cytochrome P450 [Ramicandelaber brevisporus]